MMRNLTRVHLLRSAVLLILLAAIVIGTAPNNLVLAQGGGTLGYGSRVYGTISAELPVVTYNFSGTQGDLVSITVDSWTGSLDAQLDLVAPNGVILDSSTQNTPAADSTGASLSVFLPETGVYLAHISGEANSSGDFLLTLLGRGPVQAVELVFGQPIDVTISADPAVQVFTYEAQSCPTTLIITDASGASSSPFPFIVKVRDQRGQLVAILRGGDSLEDWVTVAPDSGRYEVEVSAADSTLSGVIRLNVTCAGDNPGCRAGVAGLPCTVDCPACPSRDEITPGGGCPDLHLTATEAAGAVGIVTVSWDGYSGASGYSVYVTGLMSGGGEVYLTHSVWNPGDPLTMTFEMPTEGYSGFTFTLHVLIGDDWTTLCAQQVTITLTPDQQQTVTLCQIRADREGVPVRVGPGPLRSVFAYLNPGIPYDVTAQAADEDGTLWWQVDKSQFSGGEGVTSLWVLQSDVVALGDCGQIPQGEIPPVIPDDGNNPGNPGQWLPCGSCSTCGHPANECVTSPEGLCLWDPATCSSSQPDNPGGACYAVSASIDLGQCQYTTGSVTIDTPPNCQGTQYTPGTSLSAHVSVSDSKCIVHSWSGCNASGSGSSVTFTPGGSCTVIAHMGY